MVSGKMAYSDDFNALGSQSLRGGLGLIAGDAPDFEVFGENGVCEDCPDDGTALVPSGSENSEKL